jgi:hypothetical protein
MAVVLLRWNSTSAMPWFALLGCGVVGEEEVEGLEQQHSQLLHRDIVDSWVYADHSLIGASDQ